VVHEIVTHFQIAGEEMPAKTVALGCDACIVTNAHPPQEDDGLFTPSAAPRLAMAILGSVEIMDTFWPQMRRVLAADMATLRLDKFKTWHSIRRIPLYACRQVEEKAMQCARTLFATHRALSVIKALQESPRGHTRGSWSSCTHNVSVDMGPTQGGVESVQQIQISSMQLGTTCHTAPCRARPVKILEAWCDCGAPGFACDVRDMHQQGILVEPLSHIVEFGAGYGGLASFVHGMGFRGQYVVYDFPELTPVQSYNMGEAGMNFSIVHEAHQLENVLGQSGAGFAHISLFVAMWSLSEMPVAQRAPVVAAVSRCASFIVKYQEGFMGLDNAKYFGPGGEFRRLVEEHGHMRWTEHGGYQLTGLRTDVSPHLT